MGFSDYKAAIELELKAAIEKMGEKNQLRDACEYSLLNGGKRLRPMIVLMIGRALNFGLDVMPAALSVEFFHTASLIADDLPCMDNDAMRRGVASLHIAFPESLAILASYTLIAAGYGGIAKNSMKMKESPQFRKFAEEAALLSLEAVTQSAGIHGATHGQFLDLFPPDSSFETFEKIVQMKTSSLFEIAFTLGWLFGGGRSNRLDEVRKGARHLGMAFQIGDDLDDDLQDKSHPLGSSLIPLLGRKRALELYEKELFSFKETLEKLGLWTEDFQRVYKGLRSRERLIDRLFVV